MSTLTNVVANKILHIILHVKQDDQNSPEMSTHELYITLSFLKLHDVYNYYLPEFITFTINDDRDPRYLRNFMNHIYLYKIIIQEINVLIFLQLDWMLKGTLLFFKV